MSVIRAFGRDGPMRFLTKVALAGAGITAYMRYRREQRRGGNL